MEELQLSLTPQRVDQRNFGIMLSNWRVGQVLNALVVDTRPEGGVLLSVGGKSFVATTDLPVQPGMRMALEVKQLGAEILLRQLPGQSQSLAGAEMAATRQIPAAISAQTTTPAALLNQLAKAPLSAAGSELQAVVRDLLGRALKGETIKGADIQRLFKQSGLFGEAQLAAGQTQGAQQSAKAAVMQMQSLALAAMQNPDADPVERRQLESLAERAAAMLNGLNNQQLASLPREDGGQRWLVILPLAWRGQFRDVRLQIEREAADSAATEALASWRVVVNLELPQLGAIEVALRMRAEHMSVDFTCSKARTEKLLTGVLPQLASRLEEKAFRVEALQAKSAAAAKSADESAAVNSAGSPGFEAKA